MRKRTRLALAAMAVFMVASNAKAATSVNVNIGGLVPPPPGVHVAVESARPPREPAPVIIHEKEGPRYKEKRGHAYGHYKHDRGHGKHGKGKHGRRD